MQKKCNVVMLYTEKADGTVHNGLWYNPNTKELIVKKIATRIGGASPFIPVDLYFTTDEEIKRAEWAIFPNTVNGKIKDYEDCQPVQAASNYANNGGIYNQKIVATTNSSLLCPLCNYPNQPGDGICSMHLQETLPMGNIPDTFLENYAREQGKITEVLLEEEEFSYPKELKLNNGYVVVSGVPSSIPATDEYVKGFKAGYDAAKEDIKNKIIKML